MINDDIVINQNKLKNKIFLNSLGLELNKLGMENEIKIIKIITKNYQDYVVAIITLEKNIFKLIIPKNYPIFGPSLFIGCISNKEKNLAKEKAKILSNKLISQFLINNNYINFTNLDILEIIKKYLFNILIKKYDKDLPFYDIKYYCNKINKCYFQMDYYTEFDYYYSKNWLPPKYLAKLVKLSDYLIKECENK